MKTTKLLDGYDMQGTEPKYYDITAPPLLLQGFERQLTNDATPILLDQKEFITEVNRGVVNYLDWACYLAPSQVTAYPSENVFNGTLLTVIAGGQELLRDEPLERFNYTRDIGFYPEQKVPVIINGGQTVQSKIFLPAPTDNSPLNQTLLGQLLLHYTTKSHHEWLKTHSHFGNGLGLKRRAFRHISPAGAPEAGTTLEGVIPKNEGNCIGFSILGIGEGQITQEVSLFIDGLEVIKNVLQMHFSKLWQRDPFIFWIALQPGSSFDLRTREVTGAASTVQTNTYLTFYFDN